MPSTRTPWTSPPKASCIPRCSPTTSTPSSRATTSSGARPSSRAPSANAASRSSSAPGGIRLEFMEQLEPPTRPRRDARRRPRMKVTRFHHVSVNTNGAPLDELVAFYQRRARTGGQAAARHPRRARALARRRRSGAAPRGGPTTGNPDRLDRASLLRRRRRSRRRRDRARRSAASTTNVPSKARARCRSGSGIRRGTPSSSNRTPALG